MTYLPLDQRDEFAPVLLEDGDVHVWRSTLDLPTASLSFCLDVLSADEHARAARYRFERDRRRFIAARGLLRSLLGRYTSIPPAAIHLRAAHHGKPALEPASDLEFNVSHSHEVGIYAFARRPVGVDIERLRPLPDALDIAGRFFSSQEVEALRRTDGPRLTGAFFTCWTRKEAYLKARGEGIGHLLRSFSVSVDPERPAFVACDDETHDPHRWTLANLEVANGYVAALAGERPLRRLVQRCCTEAAPRPGADAGRY